LVATNGLQNLQNLGLVDFELLEKITQLPRRDGFNQSEK
jgi:hypothetical protein